jgi:hypothetical protein
MQPDLKLLREQLRRLRELSRDELTSMLGRMQRDCHALVSTVQNMSTDAEEPVDLVQIQTVVGTLGNSTEALITAIQSGTFREFGGPEELLDELITSGREPTAEELSTIVRALDSALR